MKITFAPATLQNAKLKMMLAGPAGSGKTKTSLLIARGLVGDTGRIALVDTEGRRASNYAGQFKFDTVYLEDFSPDVFIDCIHQAELAQYDSLIIDSASHEWMGEGGVLSIVDAATQASQSKNQFTSGWSKGTPLHQRFVEAIIRCKCHLIVTVRAKMDYILVNNVPKKVGLAPVQRDGLEYEFDVTAMLDDQHNMTITKTSAMFEELDDKIYTKPGLEFGQYLAKALSSLEAVPAPEASVVQKPAVGGNGNGGGNGTQRQVPPRASAFRPMSDAQKAKATELAQELYGGEGIPISELLDTKCKERFGGKTFAELSVEEGSQVINGLLAAKKQGVAVKPAAKPAAGQKALLATKEQRENLVALYQQRFGVESEVDAILGLDAMFTQAFKHDLVDATQVEAEAIIDKLVTQINGKPAAVPERAA